ncbi:MAG: tyrosine-protein phosphatase, partial [Anaerotignum sp.]|nr:tyrosine-protein phosphatase [Anaerotignum sp.]
GFVSALLECLMGASAEEVVDDYMTTYYNYYGVETESIQYIIIAESNIEKSLASAFDIEDIRGDGVDLAAEAECYMTEKLGLTAEEIASIKANLT